MDLTNCAHACGGLGVCIAGCTRAGQAHHGCTVRLHIEVTVSLAKSHEVEVSLRSAHMTPDGVMRHTPVGVDAVPPPPFALRVDPSIKRQLLHAACGKDTASDVVGEMGNELRKQAVREPDSVHNSRYHPSREVIAGATMRQARTSRGDAELGDWDRLNRLVSGHLIQSGCVLYFEPFVVLPEGKVTGILVMASEWSLRLGCNAAIAGTDSKYDTSAGRSFYSSIRVPTQFGHQPVSIWIAPNEDEGTIATSLQATLTAVPCADPTCPHTWSTLWTATKYRRWRECEVRSFNCDIVSDKHMPTAKAIRAMSECFQPLPCPLHPSSPAANLLVLLL